MMLKHALLRHCSEFVRVRTEAINSKILDLQRSLTSETKSSAGDKHETGRAMLQLEREKTGQQLAEIQKLLPVLKRIDCNKKQDTIALGSIVETNGSHYFIAISAGEIKINNTTYFAISSQTPMAKLLVSKKKGDLVSFRGNQIRILNVI